MVISAITEEILGTNKLVSATEKLSKPLQSDIGHFKSFSAATKVILATNNLMSAPKTVISVTEKVNLTTKNAITVS